MKAKRLPLWLCAVGTLFLVPGAMWVAGSRSRLNDNDDARVALQPLKRIHLNSIDRGPVSVTLVIPETTQWTKIRNAWGEPALVISAVAGRLALCLPEMPVQIELMNPMGGAIPLQPYGGPYGYSTACASSSLRFHAGPGNELVLKLARTSRGTIPASDIIVVGDWFNTKDKLVGLELDKDVESFVIWVAIPGVLLVASGAGVFLVNRLRRHASN